MGPTKTKHLGLTPTRELVCYQPKVMQQTMPDLARKLQSCRRRLDMLTCSQIVDQQAKTFYLVRWRLQKIWTLKFPKTKLLRCEWNNSFLVCKNDQMTTNKPLRWRKKSFFQYLNFKSDSSEKVRYQWYLKK